MPPAEVGGDGGGDGGLASLHVLLTLRATSLPTHAGQVSLPGGHLLDGEDASAAALREAGEELGAHLPWAGGAPLARLPDALAVTGTHVSVLLAACTAQRLELARLAPPPDEVAAIFSLPLRALCDPARHGWRWHAARAGAAPRGGLFLPTFDGGGPPEREVWGLTAWLLYDFLRTVVVPVAAASGRADERCLLGLRSPPPPPPPPPTTA